MVAIIATKKEIKKKKCPICGDEKNITTGFYKSSSPLFSLDGCVPICISCVKSDVINDDGTVNENKLKTMCQRLDKPFYLDELDTAFLQCKSEHGYLSDDEVAKYGGQIVGFYFKNINTLRQNKDKNFADSEKDGFIHKTYNVNARQKKEKLSNRYTDVIESKTVSTSLPTNTDNENKIKWSEQDSKNMEYAIEVVGYDPFEDYPDENRRFLFNSLSPYLEDDDNVEDAYKLSQIIQIVDNNNQIRICNKRIANLDQIKDKEEIKTLQSIKKDLVQSNDKIAKENEISVKNRSNKDAGKSTLTYLMRDLREKDFDKAEADYYDQLRGEGTQWAISVSQKAILDHCLFDENDKKEIYEHNLKITNELYHELDAKKEEIRQLLIKIDNLTVELNNIKAVYGLS